jgi:hypothetical protein
MRLDPRAGPAGENIDVELKYQFYVNAPHEFMASFGLDTTWANTGTKNFDNPFNTFRPLIQT